MQQQFFIEQIRDVSKPTGKIVNMPCNPIEKMEGQIERTRKSLVLRTVAVFKIKLKPGVMIARYENDLKATIVS